MCRNSGKSLFQQRGFEAYLQCQFNEPTVAKFFLFLTLINRLFAELITWINDFGILWKHLKGKNLDLDSCLGNPAPYLWSNHEYTPWRRGIILEHAEFRLGLV